MRIIDIFGYKIISNKIINTSDFADFNNEVVNYVKKYTMTEPNGIISLLEAVRYIEENKIKGTYVECGVWKGGSIMAIIKQLQNLNITNRNIILYDSFEGSENHSKFDISTVEKFSGKKYMDNWNEAVTASEKEVRTNIAYMGYDKSLIQFIVGQVENTIPENNIKEIALLRLDTDFYESTKIELEYLFPKLSKGGIVIIDDYSLWQGSKKATDEYFKTNNIQIYLQSVFPYGLVFGVKQ